MLRSVTSPDALASLVLNATLIASVAILPVLVTAYAVCGARARRVGPDCSLVELERIELDRAVLLYERVSGRLKEIQQECSEIRTGFLARYRRKPTAHAEEEKGFQAYAVHLRSTIVQLRGEPIRRFRRWMHLASSQVAFSSCLLLYASVFCLLTAVLWDDPAWAREVKSNLESFLAWRLVDDRLFYANWAAATLALMALPMLYCIRRARLRSRHRSTLRDLKAFAGADPDTLIPFARADGFAGADEFVGADEQGDDQSWASTQSASSPAEPLYETWSDVLRVPPFAGLDEIKTAYKLLIKQNHPDRVHGMAPLFRELAEAETKRINAAYQEALLARAEMTPA